MANFAKGLAAGFESGYKLGEMYRAGKMRREIEEAQKEKEFGRYSQERADKLQALSKETDFPNMLDEKGDPLKPKYKFTIKPGSTEYDVIPLTYSEAPPAAAAAVANLTPEQEAYLRNIEAAKDRSGRPYYSVDRGEGGLATVRARPVSDGGGFEYYNPSQAPMGSIRYLAEETAAYTEDGRPPAQVVITPEEIKAREAERAELLRQYGSTAEFRPTAGLAKQGGPSVGVPTGAVETMSPDVIEYLGKTYEQGLTPGKLSDKQKNAALMDKYAQILSAYDPVEGIKFKIMAEQERRAAEKAPLELENLAQNIAGGKIDLETKGFTLEDIKKVRSLTEWMSTNPNATTKDIFAQADKLKLSTKARSEVIQQLTGITQGELDLAKTQITKEISGMNRKQLLQAHRDNPNITPGAHYEEVLDNKGNISLYLVDTATGKRLTSKPDFIGSAAEVDKYLRTAAVAPDTLLDFTINLRKSNADIYSKESSAQRDLAYANYLGQKGSALGGTGVGKTPFAVKSMIDNSEKTIELISKQLADRPNDKALLQQLTIEKFNLANLYKSNGIDIDPYRYAGVPSPKNAISANDIKNLTPDELEARVAAARKMFGDKYADEFLSVIQENRPKAGSSVARGLEKAATESKTPVQDNKKYIRSKNPRGGWVYEESPRGLTKAQYAEIDAAKK